MNPQNKYRFIIEKPCRYTSVQGYDNKNQKSTNQKNTIINLKE